MTERRANKIEIINYPGGTIQPEALHPMLKKIVFLAVTALGIQP